MSKQLYWWCKCGAHNFAPADQSPDNRVTCAECASEFEWSQAMRIPSPKAPSPTPAKPCP